MWMIAFPNGALGSYQLASRRERGDYWEIDGTRGQIIGSDLFRDDAEGKRTRCPLEAETAPGQNGPTLVRMKVATNPPVVWENPYKECALPAGADDVARADQLFSIYHAVVEG